MTARRSSRRKAWTYSEARDLVVLWLSQQTGTVKLPAIVAGSTAPVKLVREVLDELRKAEQVRCWPAYGPAWQLTDRGRELAADIDMKRQAAAAASTWQWNPARRAGT